MQNLEVLAGFIISDPKFNMRYAGDSSYNRKTKDAIGPNIYLAREDWTWTRIFGCLYKGTAQHVNFKLEMIKINRRKY